MPSSYTQNGGIEKPANGELPNTWGDAANRDFDIIDRLTNGVGTIALAGTTYTLTTASGSLSEGQFKVLVFTGSLASACTVTISPNTAQKYFFVRNSTNQSVILTQGSGATVTIPAAQSRIIYSDGAGATAAVFDFTSVFGTTNAVMTTPTITTPTMTGGTINSTVIGGTTPAAGTFTTLAGNTSITGPSLTSASTLALTATGANNITLTTNGSERARIDASGNLGLGVTPSAWGVKAMEIAGPAFIGSSGPAITVSANGVYSGSAWSYKTTAAAGAYGISAGGHYFYTAPSGTAGNAITFTQAMTLDASGNLGVGITPTQRLHVSGNGIITGSWTVGTQTIGNVSDTITTPAYTWSTDLTTGIYHPATSTVGITTAGVERVRWDTSLMTLASGVGVVSTAANDGTRSSGTYTPTPSGGNFKYIVNGGAFTLAAPSATGDYTLVVQVTNNATAGVITMSGFAKVTGDAFTTTDTQRFLVFITKMNGTTNTTAVVQALQ